MVKGRNADIYILPIHKSPVKSISSFDSPAIPKVSHWHHFTSKKKHRNLGKLSNISKNTKCQSRDLNLSLLTPKSLIYFYSVWWLHVNLDQPNMSQWRSQHLGTMCWWLSWFSIYDFLFRIFETGKGSVRKNFKEHACLRERQMLHSRAACGLNGSQLAHRHPCPESPIEEVHFHTPSLQSKIFEQRHLAIILNISVLFRGSNCQFCHNK